jgi:hypothetical protein
MANIEGLQKTLEFIKENPTQWDQNRWHMCFAGASLRVLKGAVLGESDCCDICRDLTIDGNALQVHEIAELASEALGLTVEQEGQLFHACNTLADLECIVAEISAEVTATVAG